MAKSYAIKYIELSTAGGTELIDLAEPYNEYVIMGNGVMAADWTISPSGTPISTNVKISMRTTFTLGAFNFTVFGQTLTANQVLKSNLIECQYNDTTAAWLVNVYPSFTNTAFITGSQIAENTVANANLTGLARGFLKVGDASGRPADVDFNGNGQIGIGDGTDYNSVAITGDIGLTSAGVTSITAGAIVNADVNAAAAIAFSKLAALPSTQILVGSAGNVATAVTMTGDVAISNTGVTTIQAGSVDAAMLSGTGATEIIIVPVSFVTASQCQNSFILPFAGTITSLTSFVTTALSATDDATITAQIAGVAVTNGQITLNASSALNTSDSATPTALNTFTAGQRIDLVSAKATSGGTALVSVTVVRT